MKTAYIRWIGVSLIAAGLLAACGGGGGNPGTCQGSDEVCKRGSASVPTDSAPASVVLHA